jgi:hypothetical protein
MITTTTVAVGSSAPPPPPPCPRHAATAPLPAAVGVPSRPLSKKPCDLAAGMAPAGSEVSTPSPASLPGSTTTLLDLLAQPWFTEGICTKLLHPLDLLVLSGCCRVCRDSTDSSWQLLCEAHSYVRFFRCGWRASYLSHLRSKIATRTVSLYQKLDAASYRGVVYKSVCKATRDIVLLKKYRYHHCDDQGMPSTFIREISLMRELRHPNIVRMLELVPGGGDEAHRFYIICEWCAHQH